MVGHIKHHFSLVATISVVSGGGFIVPGLAKILPKRNIFFILGFFLALALAALAAGRQIKAANTSLDRPSVQLEKITAASHLEKNLMAQSYYIKGYMLYGDSANLRQFRNYAALNREELQALYGVVRPERKPLVEKIQQLNEKYTQLCEREIIPKVEHFLKTAGEMEVMFCLERA